jgi:hypothetical protein
MKISDMAGLPQDGSRRPDDPRDVGGGRAAPRGGARGGRIVRQRETLQHLFHDPVAARAGEGEGALEHVGELPAECPAQQAARPEKARAHRLGEDVERGGGLLDGKLLDGAQHEDGAKLGRQVVDRALEQLADLGARRDRLRRGMQQVVERRRPARRRQLSGFVKFHCLAPPLDEAERLVQGDAREPSREAGLATPIGECGEGADIGFLHDLLSLEIVLHDGADEAEEPAIVAPHDLRECRTPPLSHERDELDIRVVVGAGRERLFHHHAH